MAKNSNSKAKPVKRDEPMNSAMKLFLAGCVAELYLLVIRRCYANGTAQQQIDWYDKYLNILMGAGAAVFAVGVILSLLWKADRKKRAAGWSVTAAGAFVALSSFLIRWNVGTLTLLTVAVPVAMLLGVLWSLYDRECALSLTILGVSLIALWVCRREAGSIYLGTYVKLAAGAYIILLAVVAFLTKSGRLGKLLPPKADPLPVYVACGLSAAAVAAALFSTVIAYYTMWALGMVVFGLAVYYTVKQL
nr:hypothetical protein [uncultured Dysosmobacter sp.]